VVLAIAVSIALMAVDARNDLLKPVRQTLATVVYPVQLLAAAPENIADAVSRQFRSRRELLATIERLQDQHLMDKARMQRMDSLEVENIRLRDLLGSSYDVSQPVLISELMEVDLDPYSQLVQIDKGISNGVYGGQPVIDAKGIIGQVDQSSRYTAQVRLITDPAHSTPVQINRTGVRTVAEGTGKTNQLRLTSLPNNTDVRTGDLLVSSGLGDRFPAGYPVARVDHVNRGQGTPFARVTATPVAALNRLQEVLLIRGERNAPRMAGPDGGLEGTRSRDPSS